ncbi:effector-associated domain EAD1-containing protein [Okeania sp. KiyG1]|uniref:effector-associated domain EAD1-containing protein n=1 Tax=Okeania sp. KiyG1 TaxID=2720165 RepID=UPI0019223878|nr:effector-associated domain EAD1-containing protein [Okeania sp. KiyG1]
MPLSNSEIEKLFEALLDAYRDYNKLQRMVKFKLGENLERFAGRGDLETVVFNLIDSAEARGKLERLILGAYEQNPDNPELKKFYETVFKNFKQRKIVDSDVTPKDFGPNIDWRSKTDEIELQRFFKKQPDWYDVGFLQRIIEQAKSVCRVDLPSLNITATGVLIASKYVLTNYHVLKLNDKDNPELNTKNVRLNFGCFSLNDGRETQSKSFLLDSENPIIASSPVAELDYILLQLEEAFIQTLNSDDTTIKPAQWETNISLSETDSINILQHPNGESMKLSITCDGITGIYPNSGLVQYINKTTGGSSGSPCFNENGELVALHHAQRSKSFGTIREGILFSSIYYDLAQKSIKFK